MNVRQLGAVPSATYMRCARPNPSPSNVIVMNTNQERSICDLCNAGDQPSAERTDGAVLRRFLEESGVVGNTEPMMSILQMRSFVRWRLKPGFRCMSASFKRTFYYVQISKRVLI